MACCRCWRVGQVDNCQADEVSCASSCHSAFFCLPHGCARGGPVAEACQRVEKSCEERLGPNSLAAKVHYRSLDPELLPTSLEKSTNMKRFSSGLSTSPASQQRTTNSTSRLSTRTLCSHLWPSSGRWPISPSPSAHLTERSVIEFFFLIPLGNRTKGTSTSTWQRCSGHPATLTNALRVHSKCAVVLGDLPEQLIFGLSLNRPSCSPFSGLVS